MHVEVRDLAVAPREIATRLGDTSNDDFVADTATARNAAWDVKLPPHAAGGTVTKAPGDIEYYCRYHPTMKGKISIAP